MTISRRQESRLRLETLGHLSDYYSDVASISGRSSAGSIDVGDESQWELDSNGSKESTLAVLFDKPPPPGYRASKRTVGEGTRPSSSGEESRDFPVNLSLPNKPYVIHGDGGQSQTSNTSQLKPAKGLRRTRHPSILRPRTEFQSGECGASTSSKAPETPDEKPIVQSGNSDDNTRLTHPAALCSGQANWSRATSDYGDEPKTKRISYSSSNQEKPLYYRTGAHGNHASRPIATYSAYRPPAAGPSQEPQHHTIRTSVSLCETPSTYHRGNASENGDDTRSNYSIATYSDAPRPTSHLSSRGAHSTPKNGFSSSRRVARIGGVDFELVSAPFAPTPSPAPTPVPTPAPTVGPAPSVSSAHGCGGQVSMYPPSRSPSPAYGAWESDQPRQKQPSFLERTQARLEHSIHEHLVKAGLRPLPSFKVLGVEKSPTDNAPMRPEQEGRRSPVHSPSAEASWRTRVKRLQSGGSQQPPVPIPLAEKRQSEEDWEISSGSEAEAEPIHAKQRLRNSGLRSLTPVGGAALTSSIGRGPKLRINTSFGESSVPSSDDSLFLGRGNSGLKHPASYSFFSSEYAQRRLAADMERDQAAEQRQPAQAQSSGSPRDQDEKVELNRARSSTPLSREQLQFAALPSPLEDLGRPFPFDDRRDLPSHTRPQDPAKKHSLMKKKGMQLR
ncbi:hypothetical protein F4824DRAFT_326282 [Ustulina deusta]|nr:hypothetical protein F4824DRAFT_326282 [Ustulina deusta]